MSNRIKAVEQVGRLKELIASLGISQSDFLKRVKFSPSYLSQKSFKQSMILPSSARRLQEFIPNLNVDWLLDGEGEMTTDGQPARIIVRKSKRDMSDSFNGNGNADVSYELYVAFKDRIVQLEKEVERLLDSNIRLQESNKQLGDIIKSVLSNGSNVAR